MYNRGMRKLLVIAALLAACSSPPKKGSDSPIVKDGSAVPDNCCCKSNPLTSEDGKPVFEMANRMECSTKNGECEPDVQCQHTQQPD